MKWYVYIARCSDDSLYTGITTDLKRRISEHNSDNARGSKYLRGRRPICLVYYEEQTDESAARKREAEIKHWKRRQKLLLVGKIIQGLRYG